MAKKSNPNNLFVGNKHLNHEIGIRKKNNLRQAYCKDCNKHLQWLDYATWQFLQKECKIKPDQQYKSRGNWL